MNYQPTFLKGLKQGCLFYALSTLLLAIQFGCYIIGSNILEFMDFEGWVFFIASCISHASQFALVPYLLGILVLAFRCPKSARVVQIVGVVLLCVLNYLNSQVYAIYHFHINGFVLSMVFGEGAGEIFNFSVLLYLKEIVLFLIVAAIVIMGGISLIASGSGDRKHMLGSLQAASLVVPYLPTSGTSMPASTSIHQ